MGELFRCIIGYCEETETRSEDAAVGMAFDFLRVQFDLDVKKYAAACERNRENATARWRKRSEKADTYNKDNNKDNNRNENKNDAATAAGTVAAVVAAEDSDVIKVLKYWNSCIDYCQKSDGMYETRLRKVSLSPISEKRRKCVRNLLDFTARNGLRGNNEQMSRFFLEIACDKFCNGKNAKKQTLNVSDIFGSDEILSRILDKI